MAQLNDNLTDWVNLFTDELYQWAFHKISNAALAADLVQETFLAAAEKIESFKGDSSPKTWLFSILNHKIIDHYRKKVNQPLSLESQVLSGFFEENGDWQESRKPREWQDNADENLLDDDEFLAILKKCLESLPEKWSIAVKLKYLSEKDGEEICQELGITTSNFWQIIHRAKVKLRDCVDKNWLTN